MKKFIRILIPVILALALILLSVWYLFIYDKEFTQDMLLGCARFFEKQGSHESAQWFYNKAYEQAESNDDVAIELARQYLEMGNYTQAEYTLDNAIRDGGGVELYAELCNVYVQQDKLLDALKLLNDSTGAVKEQLDAMRPAAPVPDPEPQDINMYISVSITSESGTVYAVTGNDNECPSLATDKYTDPIPLENGTNIIRAITVDDNGLVSTLQTFQYTVGGVVEEVSFADPAMEAALRETMGMDSQTTVMTSDLWKITTFQIPEEATDYSDLQHLTFLDTLTIENGASDQLSMLSGRSNLKTLTIRGTSISQEDLEIIGKLPLLQSLTLENCGLSTSAPLSGLTKLTYLNLSNNSIRDIEALSGMVNLQTLVMNQNSLVDVSPLAACTALTSVDVSYNSIGDISPVFALTGLTRLGASYNVITSVAGIESLVNLTQFYGNNCQLTDVAGLAGCSKLTEVDVSNNQLTDVSALGKLTALVTLNISHNQITALPTWPAECALVTIDGSHNQISTVEPLSGLKALNNVLLDYNPELTTLDPLVNCPVLIKVNAYGTKVIDVDLLSGTDEETGLNHGVIVNYDPTQAIAEQEAAEEDTEE